ncbi:MAG: hypothetical protein HAW65_00190, partial [Alphaproteobacteria bacterium]|nr:hypothetical protein [Alphaproteobacteria bacterium]
MLSSTSFAPLHSKDERQPLKKFRHEGISLVPLLAGMLAACGGGGGTTYVPIAVGPTPPTTGSGEAGAFRVSVGSSVIEGAAVYVDVNNDGVIDAGDRLLGTTGSDGVVRDTAGAVVGVDEATDTRLIADLAGAYNLFTGDTYAEGTTYSVLVDGTGRDVVLSPVTTVLDGLLADDNTVAEALNILFPNENVTIEDVNTLSNYVPARDGGTRASDPILDVIAQTAIDLQALLNAVRDATDGLTELQVVSRVVAEIVDADDTDTTNDIFDRTDDLVVDLTDDNTDNAEDLRTGAGGTDAIFQENRARADGQPIAVPDLVNPNGVVGIEDVIRTAIGVNDWGFRDPGDRPSDPGTLASIFILGISVAGGDDNEGTAVSDVDAAMIANARLFYTDASGAPQTLQIASVSDLQIGVAELSSVRILVDQNSDYHGTISIRYRVIDNENQRSDEATLRVVIGSRPENPTDIFLTGDRDNSNDDRYNDDNNVANSRSGAAEEGGRYVVYNGYIRDAGGNVQGILSALDPHYREDQTLGNAQDEVSAFTLGGRDAAVFEIVWDASVNAGAGGVVLRVAEGATIEAAGYVYQLSITVTDSENGVRTESYEIVQSGLFIIPDGDADDAGQDRAYSSHAEGIVDEELATPYTVTEDAFHYNSLLIRQILVEFAVRAGTAGALEANEIFSLVVSATAPPTPEDVVESFVKDDTTGFTLVIYEGAIYQDAVRFLNTADTATIADDTLRTALEAFQAVYGNDSARLFSTNENQRRFDFTTGIRDDLQEADALDLEGSSVSTVAHNVSFTEDTLTFAGSAASTVPDFTPIAIGQLGIEGYDPADTAVNTRPITFTVTTDEEGATLADTALFEITDGGVVTYTGDVEALAEDIGNRDTLTNPEDDPETTDIDESATVESREADSYTVSVEVSFTQTFAHTAVDGGALSFTGQRGAQRDGIAADAEGDIDTAEFHYSGGEITNTNAPAVAANATIANNAGSASFLLTAATSEAAGNDIDYVITQSETEAAVAVSLSGSTISIVLGSGGSRIEDIVTALNEDTDIAALVTASAVSGASSDITLGAIGDAVQAANLTGGTDTTNTISVAAGVLYIDGDRTQGGTSIAYDGIAADAEILYLEAGFIIVSEDTDDDGVLDGTWSAKLVDALPSGDAFYVLGALSDPVEMATAAYDVAARPAPATPPPAPATTELAGITFTYDTVDTAHNNINIVFFYSSSNTGFVGVVAGGATTTPPPIAIFRVGDVSATGPTIADVVELFNTHSTTEGLGITASVTSGADANAVFDRGTTNIQYTNFTGARDNDSASIDLYGLTFQIDDGVTNGDTILIAFVSSLTNNVRIDPPREGENELFRIRVSDTSSDGSGAPILSQVIDAVEDYIAALETPLALRVFTTSGGPGNNLWNRFDGGAAGNNEFFPPFANLTLGAVPLVFTADAAGAVGNDFAITFVNKNTASSGSSTVIIAVDGGTGVITIGVSTANTLDEVVAAFNTAATGITVTLAEGADGTTLFNEGNAFLTDTVSLADGAGDPTAGAVIIDANEGAETLTDATLNWERVVENEAHEYVITLRNLDDNAPRWLEVGGFSSQADSTTIELNERQSGFADDSTSSDAILASYSVIDNDGDAVVFSLRENFGLFTISTRTATQGDITYYVGEVRLIVGLAADYEGVQFYNLNIEATTTSTLSPVAPTEDTNNDGTIDAADAVRPNATLARSLRVDILDVNDQPTAVNLSDIYLRVPAAVIGDDGVFIGTLTAIDQDLLIIPGRTNVETHSYTLSGDDAALFAVREGALYYTGGNDNLLGAGEEYSISISVSDSGNGGNVGVGIPPRDFTITQSGAFVAVANSGGTTDDVYTDGVGILSETADVDTSTTQMITHNGAQVAAVFIGAVGGNSDASDWAIAGLGDSANYAIVENATGGYDLFYIASEQPGDADARADEDDETFGIAETHTPATDTIRVVGTTTAEAPETQASATATAGALSLTAASVGEVFNGVQIRFVEGAAFTARLAGQDGDAIAATIIVSVPSGTSLGDLITAITADALLSQYVVATATITGGVSADLAASFTLPSVNVALDGGVDGVDAALIFDVPEMPAVPGTDAVSGVAAFFEIAGIRFELDQTGAGGNEFRFAIRNGDTGNSSSQILRFDSRVGDLDFAIFIPIDGQFDINGNLPEGTGQFDATNPTLQQVVDALESDTTFKTATDAAGNAYNISVSVAAGADGSAVFVNVPAGMRGTANPQTFADGVDEVVGTEGTDVVPASTASQFTGQKDALIDFDPIIAEEDLSPAANAFFEIAGIRFELDQPGAGGNELNIVFTNGTLSSSSQSISFANPRSAADFRVFIPIDGQFDINENLPVGTFDPTNPTIQQVVDALESRTTFKTATDAAGNVYNISVSVAEGADGSATFVNIPAEMRGSANAGSLEGGSTYVGNGEDASVEIYGIRFELEGLGVDANGLTVGVLTGASGSLLSYVSGVYAFGIIVPQDGNFAISDGSGGFITAPTIAQVVAVLNAHASSTNTSDGAGGTYTIVASAIGDGTATFTSPTQTERDTLNSGGDQTFAGGVAATVQTAPTETLENNSGVGTFSYHGGEISVDEFGIDVAGGALYFADRPAASFSGILNLAPTEDGFVYVSLDADGGYSAKFGTRPSDTPSYVLGYVDRDAGTDAIIDPTIAANNVVDLGGIRFAVADTASAPASIAFATRALTEEEVTADVPVLPEVAIDGTTLTITFVGDTTQTITELAAMINADAGLTGTGLVVTVSAADGTATFDATDIATSTTIEPRSSFFVAITPNNSGTAITTPEDITFVSEEVNYIINFRNENDSAPEFLAVVSGENYGVAENGTTIGATNAIGENTDRGNPNAEGEGGGPVILTVSAFDADDRKTIGEEPATTNERGASLDAAGNLVTSVITYHLDAADDSALSADNIYFTINETTGEVRLSETEIPSYEISGHQRDTSGNLILQVEVEVRSTHPSEDTAQTTRQTYEVLIADENDDPTDITISRLALVPGSNEVGSLTATDEDDIAISFNTGEVDEDGNPVPDTNRAPDSHTFALVTDADNNLEDNRSEDNGLFTIAANASGDLALTFNGADTARKGVGEFYRVLIEVTDSAGATFQKAFEFPEGSISVTRDFDSVSVDVYSNGRGTIDENSNGDTTAVTIGTLSRQGTEGVALDNVTFALVNGLVYTGASGAATLASTTFTATTAIDAPETLIINASGVLAVIASDAEVPADAIVFGVLTNTDDIISFEVDAGFPLVAGVYGFANNVLTIQ